MARRKVSQFDGFQNQTGWIIILILVAGSSYLLGTSTQRTDSSTPETTFTASPSTNSVISDIAETINNPVVIDQAEVVQPSVSSSPALSSPGLVSLNSGTQTELETLSGIGPAKAKAIIDYRNQFGQFIRIEDIQNVKGIGPKTFENIKARITL